MEKNPYKKYKSNEIMMSFQSWFIVLFVIMLTTSVSLLTYNYVVYKNEKEEQIHDFLDSNDRQISVYVNNLLIDLESMSLLPLFQGEKSKRFFDSYHEYLSTGIKPQAYKDYVHNVLSLLYNNKPGTVNSVFFFRLMEHMSI